MPLGADRCGSCGAAGEGLALAGAGAGRLVLAVWATSLLAASRRPTSAHRRRGRGRPRPGVSRFRLCRVGPPVRPCPCSDVGPPGPPRRAAGQRRAIGRRHSRREAPARRARHRRTRHRVRTRHRRRSRVEKLLAPDAGLAGLRHGARAERADRAAERGIPTAADCCFTRRSSSVSVSFRSLAVGGTTVAMAGSGPTTWLTIGGAASYRASARGHYRTAARLFRALDVPVIAGRTSR